MIRSLSFYNFRNLSDLTFQPSEKINILWGKNAQGKTNIMEGIWLFCGCKSFRGAGDKEMIRFGEKEAQLFCSFTDEKDEREAKITITDRRRAFLDGEALSSPVRLMGQFSAVVFSPAHLTLIKNGPGERRKFLDTALCQLYPVYAGMLSRYYKALHQRNSLLRDLPYHHELSDTLDAWDQLLANAAVRVLKARKKYALLLENAAQEIYEGISGGEIFHCSYRQSASEDDFVNALVQNREQDLRRKNTGVGPHRDDLQITIGGKSARSFASQGQQRSAALALKMAEAKILFEQTGAFPVILLDDVMSELDESRQNYILNHIENKQVFITCCDPNTVQKAKEGRFFHIENGKLTEKKEK